jgi:hypothetical protein
MYLYLDHAGHYHAAHIGDASTLCESHETMTFVRGFAKAAHARAFLRYALDVCPKCRLEAADESIDAHACDRNPDTCLTCDDLWSHRADAVDAVDVAEAAGR